MYTPSMIAAASVAAALHGLDWTGKSGFGLPRLLDELTRITAIEQVRYTFRYFPKLLIYILFRIYLSRYNICDGKDNSLNIHRRRLFKFLLLHIDFETVANSIQDFC